MAMSVSPHLFGVDVSKKELVICRDPEQPLEALDNEPKAIRRWLGGIPKGTACFAVEATNIFHLELIEQAYRRGHTVYIIDGYRLNHYRGSIGGRAKTDAEDARLLCATRSGSERVSGPGSLPRRDTVPCNSCCAGGPCWFGPRRCSDRVWAN